MLRFVGDVDSVERLIASRARAATCACEVSVHGQNADLAAPPPLISCVMPTRDRPDFALQAVRCFERQSYRARELIVVDDGEQPLAPHLPRDDRIRYVRCEHPERIGAKRNRGCELARGVLLVQWDDDDWHGPERLAAQAAPILRGEADLTGLSNGPFFDLRTQTAWACAPHLYRRLFSDRVFGGTLMFRRDVWESRARYPNRSLAEDVVFLRRALRRGCRLEAVPAGGLFVCIRHDGNTWSFACGEAGDPAGWARTASPFPAEDAAFYAAMPSPARPPIPPRRRGRRPLVSCIMPTSDRRAFVPQAIRCFLRQDYGRRELVVLDDGRDPIGDLVPDDPRIVYRRLEERMLIGDKRNVACELARGDVIAHWDDDDWSAPHRLAYQVSELERHGADVCGTRRMLYLQPSHGRAWLLELPARQRRRLMGGTLCYRKAIWSRRPFLPLANGEDVRFLHGAHARNALALEDHRFYVGLMHAANTSPKDTTDSRWCRRPLAEVGELLGADLAFYVPSQAGTATAAPSATSNL